MKKERIFSKKWNIAVMAAIFAIALAITGITSSAAAAAKIDIKETKVSIPLGEVQNLEVTYQMPEGRTVQLAVIIADESVAAAVVADNGNGKATLAISGLQTGTTVAAVYDAADPAVVDYVTVKSGMAEDGKVYTASVGDSFQTVYDDRVVVYQSLLNAKGGDRLAVTHLEVERHSGIDALLVEGQLWEENTSAAGLLTFYANFYNASGKLIERQPYYAKNTGAGRDVALIWYIPDGCTKIVLE